MPAAERRPAAWPLTVALAVALGCALAGLTPAFTSSAWWFFSAGIVLLVSFGLAVARAVTRWPLVPQIVGVGVLLGAETLVFAPATAALGVLPTGATLDAFTALVAEAVEAILGQRIPAEPVPGIVFLLSAGAGLAVLLLDLLAVGLRRPALTGLPLLALVAVPTVIAPDLLDPFWFALAAGSYLLVLYVAVGERRAGGAIAAGAVTLAIALVLPAALPPTGEPDPGTDTGGFTIGVNTFITLGENLRQPNPSRVLTYTTDSGGGQYLGMSVISRFEGTAWRPTVPEDVNDQLGLIDRAPGLDAGVPTATDVTSVRIVNMGGRWLPVPYAATSVTGMGDEWGWSERDRTVVSATDSARGAEYVVASEVATPGADALRAAGPADADELDEFLQLPDGLPEAVAETARQVTAGQTTDFDRAEALEEYFTGGQFRYSEQAPVDEGYDGTSAEVVARFLEAKAGYCVHFSSAMAVMARSLGIPSRIVVGFTPGELVAATEDKPAFHAVTTANLHAWPELWFDGVGWVRFEPTVGRGSMPDYDTGAIEPDPAPSLAPDQVPTVAPTVTVTPTPTPSATPTAGAATGAERTSIVPLITVAVVLAAALVVLLLPLLPALVRGVRRARRLWRVRRDGDAIAAWQELVDTGEDLGRPVAGLTARQFAAAVRPAIPRVAADALDRLLAAVEASAYSPAREPATVADLRRVRRALAAAATRRERVAALLAPRSAQRRR